MPNQSVYEITMWNYADHAMKMECEYIIAYDFNDALKEAERQCKGMKKTVMGVKMLGNVMANITG